MQKTNKEEFFVPKPGAKYRVFRPILEFAEPVYFYRGGEPRSEEMRIRLLEKWDKIKIEGLEKRDRDIYLTEVYNLMTV